MRRYYVAFAIMVALAVLLLVQALTDWWIAGALIVALVLGSGFAILFFPIGGGIDD